MGHKFKAEMFFQLNNSFKLLLICAFFPKNVAISLNLTLRISHLPVSDSSTLYYRLSKALEPISYVLSLRTYVPGYISFISEQKNFTFDGNVNIKFRVVSETDKIELFSKDLKLLAVDVGTYKKTWNDSKMGDLKIVKIEEHRDTDKLVFYLNRNMTRNGQYFLKIRYSGEMPINGRVVGLYSQYYKDKRGNKHYYASTHNVPFSARRMLPCFDEPLFKATWKVTVIHPQGTTAIANAMEIAEQQIDHDWIQTSFDVTPPMSSYLLAVAITDFQYKERTMASIRNKTIRFRIWLPPHLIDRATIHLDTGIKLLSYYEKLLGIPYSLPKLDMIEVGLKSFEVKAMEHWGLIVFRRWLLWNNTTMAHELAHQWFGNLVTMKYWDDFFLKEGFAVFLSKLALVGIGDKINLVSYYCSINTIVLEKERRTNNSRAPHYEPIWPYNYEHYKEKILGVFPYRKVGASVMRTIELAMGSNDFYKGVKLYLNRHQFGSADYHDLINALSEAKPLNRSRGAPKTIAEFAETWILQPGYPLVIARRHNATHVALIQTRYAEDHPMPPPKEKWWIPVFYSINDTVQPMEWLFDTLYLDVPKGSTLQLNGDLNVLYRVQYDESLNTIKDSGCDKESQKSIGPHSENNRLQL